MARKRCACHSSSLYDGLQPCPRCKHWSYEQIDAGYGACERRRCGYEQRDPLYPPKP